MFTIRGLQRLAIEGDRRLTARELENDLGIPKTTVLEPPYFFIGGGAEATSRSNPLF